MNDCNLENNKGYHDHSEYIESIGHTKLFAGIAPEVIPGLLECIDAKFVRFSKGESIIEEGGYVQEFGIMLSGKGRVIKEDESGKQITITLLREGSEIGVIIAAGKEHISPVTVETQEESVVLLIPFDRVIGRCKKGCPRHDLLLRNYINIVAEKGLMLHEQIACLLKSSIREKVLAYLRRISRESGNTTFHIPFDRNGMAEYLNVDRSALSRELSKMKRDGLIDYHKNCFKLL